MSGTGKKIALVLLMMVMLTAAGSALLFTQIRPETGTGGAQLKAFNSLDELKDFLSNPLEQPRSNGRLEVFGGMMKTDVMAESAAVPLAAGSSDYSTTNIQVEGVDEADIVKNDGKYIYTTVGNKLVIADAYPAEEAKVVSETELKGTAAGIFVNKDRLVVLERDYEDFAAADSSGSGPAAAKTAMAYPYRASAATRIAVYDISSREKPVLAREIAVSGDYISSRMIGDYVYSITNMAAYYNREGPVPLPMIAENNTSTTLEPQEIYYFGYPDYGYSYTNIIAVNTQDDNEKYNEKTFLGGSSQNIYVSENNIYLTGTGYTSTVNAVDSAGSMVKTAAVKVAAGVGQAAQAAQIMPMPPVSYSEETNIQKIAISGGSISYKGQGTVPGHVLNQFSMDEFNGYFRIAITTGQAWGSDPSSKNHIYVLDENLKTVGKVEDLAPGEKIYSARFMGNRAYLVTFVKIDPLFVIDLSQPTEPKVLGKLKIPGYSDYLQPYDENHIIGIGKEAVGAEEGNFAWYQGVKLALFDVSDPENPKEVSKYEIGDRGTDSEALRDHKAFLFSREKNLLVIPILLAEIDKSKYAGEMPPYAYGDYVWQGAYVFNIDLENGLQLKGKITHLNESDDSMLKSGYYYSSQQSVRRSLYIDNVLYTLSDRAIKMNDLESMDNINTIELFDQNNY